MSFEPKKSYWFKNNKKKSAQFMRIQAGCRGYGSKSGTPMQQTAIEESKPSIKLQTNKKGGDSELGKSKIRQSTVSDSDANNNIDLLARTVERVRKWLDTNIEVLANKDKYFQIISQNEECHKITVRCYEHNSQIILYCATDQETLCAECMHGKRKAEQASNLQFRRHHKHEVHQIEKSMAMIEKDNYAWGKLNKTKDFAIRELTKTWKNLEVDLQTSEKQYLQKLEKQFNKCSVELSRRLLTAKQKIQEFMSLISSNCQGIIKNLDRFKKLSKSDKFTFPAIQHMWNVNIMRMYDEFEKEDIGSVASQIKKVVDQRLGFFVKSF